MGFAEPYAQDQTGTSITHPRYVFFYTTSPWYFGSASNEEMAEVTKAPPVFLPPRCYVDYSLTGLKLQRALMWTKIRELVGDVVPEAPAPVLAVHVPEKQRAWMACIRRTA